MLTNSPIVNISGDRVALGPLQRDLLPLYQRWMNDFAVTGTLARGCLPVTREAEEAWYDQAAREDNAARFTIYERETLRPIGTAALQDWNAFHQTAELSLLIGETEVWGRGYGREAVRLLLDYGFHGLAVHNIMARVLTTNEPALRACLRAGFREFGRLAGSARTGSAVCDMVYLECLSTEFQSPVLAPMIERLVGGSGEVPSSA